MELRRARPMDFSDVVVRKGNMLGPEIVLRSNSYVGETTSLGFALFDQVCREAKIESPRPGHVTVSEIENEVKDIGVSPTMEEGPATLPMRWLEDDSTVRIDMTKLLLKRPFPIPEGTRAHIPLSREELLGVGPSVVFHFSQARFEPIEERKGGKKAESSPEKAAAADQRAAATAGVQGAAPGGEAGAPAQAQAPASEEE